MNWVKILVLKFKLWREMRSLSEAQKYQLKTRIWWEFEPNENAIKKLTLRIYAAKKYKEILEKRFNN
jgi:hypothetical protein